ncbi:6-phosphogluconolactonase [Marisediminicola sp. LYQ134]|uniref:6-phosphogluconolactonase n=1 Tax=unclassified Marisediminicola TaxID=2618316 RepID=UPI0039838F3D
MSADRRVLVHQDAAGLAGAVAARFITKVIDLLDEKPEVHIALTGGGVGTGILRAIAESGARDSIDWSRVHVWWGDERWVPRGDSDRNDTGAFEALLSHVAVRDDRVHTFPASDDGMDLDEGADAYASTLRDAASDGADFPVFDILFLGVGPDGHIASLFPDSAGVETTGRSVIAVRESPKPPSERLSLTFDVINNADRIWLCLAGADKASALGLALAGAGPSSVPASGARGRKRTVFFVDSAAAAEVPEDLISSEY